MAEPTEVTELHVSTVHEPKPGSLEYAASQLRGKPEEVKSEVEDVEAEEVEEVSTEDEVYEPEDEPLEEGEDETSDEDEDHEEEEEQPTEDYYSIKVDGEELEVTLDELRNGYQRQSNYTKKTQELADERKAVKAQSEELAKMHEGYMEQARLAEGLLNRDFQKFKDVDWAKLKSEDPIAYVSKQIEMQDIRQSHAELKKQVDDYQAHQSRQEKELKEGIIKAERLEVKRLFPEWNNPEKAKAGQAAIIEYARTQGYTDDDLSELVHARDLTVLDKARKYDEGISKKGAIKKKEKPAIRKLVKPNAAAPAGSGARRALQKSRDKLRKTGSLHDAAALMAARLN